MVLMMVMMRMMEKDEEQGCLKLGEAALICGHDDDLL